jgi:hypothetical protein
MDITGMLAVGNGEKCPFCELIVDKDLDTLGHFIHEHPSEINKVLFGEKDE